MVKIFDDEKEARLLFEKIKSCIFDKKSSIIIGPKIKKINCNGVNKYCVSVTCKEDLELWLTLCTGI
jgi:hypothetical protein